LRFAHYENKAVELCIADLKNMLRCPPLPLTNITRITLHFAHQSPKRGKNPRKVEKAKSVKIVFGAKKIRASSLLMDLLSKTTSMATSPQPDLAASTVKVKGSPGLARRAASWSGI
jgi:hypothetical protein